MNLSLVRLRYCLFWQFLLSLGTKLFCPLGPNHSVNCQNLEFCLSFAKNDVLREQNTLPVVYKKAEIKLQLVFSPFISWENKFSFSYTGINITILIRIYGISVNPEIFLRSLTKITCWQDILVKKPNFCCNKNLSLLAFCCCRL